MSYQPFKQSLQEDGTILREFREGVDSEELIWHRDRLDRQVTVIRSKGWRLQFDGCLPIPMLEGNSYRIPARTWHRVIKGQGPLIITIQEGKA